MGGVGAAWRFLVPAWRQAWASLLCASAYLSLAFGSRSLVGLWLLLGVLMTLIASGRLWPAAMGQIEPPRGWDLLIRVRELRLLAVAGLSFLFLFVLFLLVFVLVLCFAYAAAASGHGFVASEISTWAPAVDSRGRWVVSVVAIVCTLAWTWAAMRVSLAAPATVAEGKVLMIATWPLTRGRAWAIALAQVLTLLVPAGLTALLIAAHPARGPAPLGLALARGLVIAGLWLPLTIGLMGRLYSDLTSGQPEAALA
jgi:hypothetical protein